MSAGTTTERVPFRLLQTPCCSSLLCWVNPRLPTYCPECGAPIYRVVRSCVLLLDESAILRVTGTSPITAALANVQKGAKYDGVAEVEV